LPVDVAAAHGQSERQEMFSNAGTAPVLAGYQRASDEEAEMRRTGTAIPGGVLATTAPSMPTAYRQTA
jgi:hypothetical protein